MISSLSALTSSHDFPRPEQDPALLVYPHAGLDKANGSAISRLGKALS